MMSLINTTCCNYSLQRTLCVVAHSWHTINKSKYAVRFDFNINCSMWTVHRQSRRNHVGEQRASDQWPDLTWSVTAWKPELHLSVTQTRTCTNKDMYISALQGFFLVQCVTKSLFAELFVVFASYKYQYPNVQNVSMGCLAGLLMCMPSDPAPALFPVVLN